MKISNLPKLLPVPFANSGSKQDIPVASQIGVSGGRASYTDGFPPLTRTPIAAGGIPPFGTDFNGVLNDITSAIRWAQAGGGYGYDSMFSSSVSGYPIGAKLLNSTGDGYWMNTVDGNTNNPESASATPLTGWVPADSYGVTSITGLGGSSVTLSTLQASRDRIVLTGTLTANINVIVPAWRKSWTVVNNCTGPFSVTFKTSSGTGVVIPSSYQASVVGDGVNIVTGSLLAANNLSDLNDKNAAISNLRLGAGAPPIGIPFFWPSAVMPNTVIEEWSDMVFLKFNNSTFSAATYPKLALVYPGLTLTDHRGEFIRIWDDGRGVDSGRALLSAQDASAINLLLGENNIQPGLGQIGVANDDGQIVNAGWSVAKNPGQINNSNGTNFAKVRPRNIAWNFLVRAK